MRNLMDRSIKGVALAAVAIASTYGVSWAEDEYNPYGTPGGKYGGPHPLFATSEPFIFYHNVGLLELFVCNVGRVGNGQLNGLSDQVSAGWRGGEYLYIGAMWIGAIASDNLAYVSTGGYEFELLPELNPIDTMYTAYEGITNGNRPGFSTQPDDDNDGVTDEEFLNGIDDDGDTLIDEDYAAVSQQMYSCQYYDYTELAKSLNPEHRPLNVRVQQRSYAWSTSGSNEFVGFDFDIINDGFETLRQVYLGFFVDSDAGPKDAEGYWTDDAVALYSTDSLITDPTIGTTCEDRVSHEQVNCGEAEYNLDIMYMWDVPDDGNTATGGDVDGYFGGMFLGHTTDAFGVRAPAEVEMHTARFFSGSNPYPAGDPTNDAERYDLLQSGERSRRPSQQPGDYRYTFAAGPFAEVLPGERLQLQVAFVIGAGKDGMIRNAINAQRIYNGAWKDVDQNLATGVDGAETCLHALAPGEPQFWRDPCDSNNVTQRTIKEVECIPENYVDADCNCCTPITDGNETLVHWVGSVAPPPPGTNLDPNDWDFDDPNGDPNAPSGIGVYAPDGDHKVIIQWDNLSELTADVASRSILFTGYKVWRVEGWNRPVGAVGPAPTDWQLIADLSYDPRDGEGEESESYLPKFADANFDSAACQESGDCELVVTGATGADSLKQYRPVGYYTYVDSAGLKNGMYYFYDVTSYSIVPLDSLNTTELEGLPAAVEAQAVIPKWGAVEGGSLDGVFVVPNPYITGGEANGGNPAGWDLVPSDKDPTGTRIAFAGLPDRECKIKIFTLSGVLVRTINHDGRSGTAFWDLISRNGQDVVSGVYLYAIEAGNEHKIGRFVIIK